MTSSASEIPQHASQLRRGDRSGTSFARLLASSWQPGFRADVWSGVGDEDPTRQTAGRRYRHVLIGGGPESAIYKTIDAGAHWTKVTEGIPAVDKGRIALAVSPQKPDVVYATIDDGLITVVTSHFEGHSNYRTIEELQSNLDPNLFWRVHRSFLVNINRIREVIPWFKSSFQLRMDDKKQTEIPVSRVQTKRLRELLKL